MKQIPIEISARHVHLKPADWEKLFGAMPMTEEKAISQPGQFVAAQRLILRGPAGTIERVGIVGPYRSYTQVELAATDARRLGVEPPVTMSGNITHAVPITIQGPAGEILVPAAIIQQRHLHASPDEAEQLGLKHEQDVGVVIDGQRGARLDHVIVRLDPSFRLSLHLDTDEANACGVRPGMTASLAHDHAT